MQMDNLYPTFDGKPTPYAKIPEDDQHHMATAGPQSEQCSKPTLFYNSWEGVDPEIGLTPDEETRRSEGLAKMINLDNYSRNTYHKAFFSIMVQSPLTNLKSKTNKS